MDHQILKIKHISNMYPFLKALLVITVIPDGKTIDEILTENAVGEVDIIYIKIILFDNSL